MSTTRTLYQRVKKDLPLIASKEHTRDDSQGSASLNKEKKARGFYWGKFIHIHKGKLYHQM
jgi:hypothetical protein